jgi:hypothetical protein
VICKCGIPRIAVFCSVFTECVTGVSSGGVLNYFCTLPSAPIVKIISAFIYVLKAHYRVGTGKGKYRKVRKDNMKRDYQQVAV